MKVKIKTWKQMEEEFGLDFDGDINIDYGFIKSMEVDMPKDRIIEIDEKGNWRYINNLNRKRSWSISDDMIAEKITGE